MADRQIIAPPLTSPQRDYLLLTVFVLGQHGHFDRAKALVDGLIELGDVADDVLLAQGVLAFFNNDFHQTIACLDELDTRADSIGTVKPKTNEAERMRRYLRARCFFQTGREEEATAIAAELSAPKKKKSSNKNNQSKVVSKDAFKKRK